MESPVYYGGLADTWKGEYKGQEVTAKALRVYKTSDPNWIRKVGGAQLVTLSNELTVSHAVVL